MATAELRSSTSHSAVWILALLFSAPATAGVLRVTVVDEHGQPVDRVAVYAVPSKPVAITAGARNALMDQAHNAFVPHVLIVQTGTSVLFPNNDVVSHHVYSFSEPKTFELGLYKGNAHPPVLFDRPGLVVLGCNIHDSMLGYILVVDTPHFAQTDAQGAWTERLRPNDMPGARQVAVAADGTVSIQFKLEGKLQPDRDHDVRTSSALPWQRY
jgi:plastocyanin